jgi:inner membrane organizing system protein 1
MVRSEEVLKTKFDRCLLDTGVKMLSGFTLGAVFSLFIFKRRMWPVTLGVGTGFGMGYTNCEQSINEAYYVDVSKLQ